MKSINSVFLIDDVTRDAELRSTKPILNTGRAMNRMDGHEERSQFHTVIC